MENIDIRITFISPQPEAEMQKYRWSFDGGQEWGLWGFYKTPAEIVEIVINKFIVVRILSPDQTDDLCYECMITGKVGRMKICRDTERRSSYFPNCHFRVDKCDRCGAEDEHLIRDEDAGDRTSISGLINAIAEGIRRSTSD